MPNFETLIGWLGSGEGRLIAAALLFVLLALFKHAPIIKDRLLITPMRRRIAAAILALGPAVAMLGSDVPLKDVAVTALTLLLAATGLNTLRQKPEAPDDAEP